ncbi:MAG: glycosyltransferase [Candidatus Eremiobacteraeota bacterium]|nr:glycosyltransferase [Candidatus Eremiobacteraeota bacterium]MCL5054638.1 glycosyltransferase [Bacillota bacterium]
MGNNPPAETLDILHLSIIQNLFSSRMYFKEALGAIKTGYTVGITAPISKFIPVKVSDISLFPLKTVGSSKFRLKATWSLFHSVLKKKFSILHAHDMQTLLVGVILKKLRRCALIYDAHEDYPFVHVRNFFNNLPFDNLQNGWLYNLAFWIVSQIERYLCRSVDFVFTVDDLIAAKFSSWGLETFTLRNFAWREPPYISENTCHIKEQLTEKEVFVYLGSIDRQVAALECVQALALVRQTQPQAFLLFMGGFCDQEYETEVKKEIGRLELNSSVAFVEEIPYPEVIPTLSVAKVGLLTYSVRDNYKDRSMFTHKLCDYLGAGLPMIISDFKGLRKATESLEIARYVNPAAPESIARAMLFFLKSPLETAEMAKKSCRAFQESLNWETEQQKLLGTYARILNKKIKIHIQS